MNQQWRWRLVPAMRGADISQGEAFNPPESSPHDGIVGGGYCTRACRIAACMGDREWELAGAAAAPRLALLTDLTRRRVRASLP